MATLSAIDMPTVPVAAVASAPAPAAVDFPAVAAAWTAIDCRVELNLLRHEKM